MKIHYAKIGGRRRDTNLSTADGDMPSWPAIRAHVLASSRVCVMCNERPATEVDHIWPTYYGGDDWSSNLRPVCSPCNKAKGNRVDHKNATTHNLFSAATANVVRIGRNFTDNERFVDEVRHRAVVEGLRTTGGQWANNLLQTYVRMLADVAEEIQREVSQLQETLDGIAELAAEEDEFNELLAGVAP